jgi:hypothetical protein
MFVRGGYRDGRVPGKGQCVIIAGVSWHVFDNYQLGPRVRTTLLYQESLSLVSVDFDNPLTLTQTTTMPYGKLSTQQYNVTEKFGLLSFNRFFSSSPDIRRIAVGFRSNLMRRKKLVTILFGCVPPAT